MPQGAVLKAVVSKSKSDDAGWGEGAYERLPDANAVLRLNRSTVRFLSSLVREPLSAVPDTAYDHGIVVTRALGRLRAYVSGPNLIQDAFVKEADALSKGRQNSVLEPALGAGLLTAEGGEWRWQRRTLSPGFAHGRLQSLAPAMLAAAEAMRDTLLAEPAGAAVDIGRETARVTLRILGDTMLACAGNLDPGRVERGIADFLKPAPWAIALSIAGAPAWMPYPGRKRSLAAAAEIRVEVARAVAARRAGDTADSDDLMTLLLAARDPDGGRAFTDAEITDNVVTFVTAGHETTSVALTWALHLLSLHPAVARKVRGEVDAVAGDGPLLAEHVARLGFTRQVVNETLRLYPPAPIISRVLTRPIKLGGVSLPTGSVLVLPIHAVHRHRALWNDPEAFDPSRFVPDRVRERHRYAFMPFGVGPRVCIGNAFALLEATIILAVLVRALDFAPTDDRPPRPSARLTLRPHAPLRLRVSPRATAAA